MNRLYTQLKYNSMLRSLGSIRMIAPATDNRIVADSEALLNIVAWGDPQISSLSPLRAARMFAACADVANADGKFDALLMLGDITEYGRQCEFDMVANLLKNCDSKYDNLLCVTGNHDIRLRSHKKQVAKFNSFMNSVKGGKSAANGHYWFSTEIKGYKFIMLGSDAATFEGEYLSRAQLAWLDSELSSVPKGKPCFVLNHQTLKNTNGLPYNWEGSGKWRGSAGWQSDRLGEILSKHNNVIFITGHLHRGFCEWNYEDCGGFKSLSLPTIGVINHGDFDADGQGYVISVYKDKIIVRARVFAQGRWINGIPGTYIEIPIVNK